MKLKKRVLLIDDMRTNTDAGCSEATVIVRDYDEAVSLLFSGPGWDLLLIDHDLGDYNGPGGNERNGYDIMCLIEEEWYRNKEAANQLDMPGFEFHHVPKEIRCVSSNGPGRQRIQQVIDKLKGE